MDAKTYFTNRDTKLSREGSELVRCARLCDVTPYYLFMVVRGYKTAGPELAANLEYATNGVVDRRVTLPEFPWDAPANTTEKVA